jgi:hypothetical protein
MTYSKLALITGAGASISFGYPSTKDFTLKISQRIKDPAQAVSPSALSLLDQIQSALDSYLINPRAVTFEDIYQGIHDVCTLRKIPTDPDAFNEFRPRAGATHQLKKEFEAFSESDVSELQYAYLDSLLNTFLVNLTSISSTAAFASTISKLEQDHVVWSFTLNYDTIIDEIIGKNVSGFIPGTPPRGFDPSILEAALSSEKSIHVHLHGSLKWGFPSGGSADPFALHEFDTPKDGVAHSMSRPSGRPILRGETLPPSPVITGLDKAELVFREPFFSNFMTYFRSLNLCNSMLIAGYGFSDYHLNIGIRNCRMNRPDVNVYLVCQDAAANPELFLSLVSPVTWDTILPEDNGFAGSIPQIMPGFPGWWKVPGNTKYNTSPIYLWPGDFKAFCDAVTKSGLPR